METDCIFCKIIKKEVPCNIIWENKKLLAFLDVNPASPGHVLIIPKEHFETIFDTPKDILSEINIRAKQIGKLQKEKLKATGVNILNASGKDAQQSVGHLHYHIVPRYQNDKLNLWFHGEGKFQDNTENIHKKLTS
jgi:histidine triad (HIT) family protein